MGGIWTRMQLWSRTPENTPAYNCAGQRVLGKIVHVYDGDTCTAILRYGKQYQTVKLRCFGYDSPEMKPLKTMIHRDEEIAAAKKAKEALETMILGQIVHVHLHGFDKYGRFLATLFVRRGGLICGTLMDVNAWMVENQYGVPYFGGTKPH